MNQNPDGLEHATGRGQFFALDSRHWFEVLCLENITAACAYLVMARGTHADNRFSSWSAEAVRKYLGVGIRKALIAKDRLITAGLIRRDGGTVTHPRYDLRPHNYEDDETSLIWLPNAIIDGVDSETPPVKLLRQGQDLGALRLFVALYDATDLPEHGGIPRALLRQKHEAVRVGQRGPFSVWGFEIGSNMSATFDSPLMAPFKTGKLVTGPDGKKRDAGWMYFWDALGVISSSGVLEFVPHVLEADTEEAEILFPHPVADSGHACEREIGDVAQEAGEACLTEGQLEGVRCNGLSLFPLPSHIVRPAVISIARLRYRPRTKATGAWFAQTQQRAEYWIPRFRAITEAISNNRSLRRLVA